MTDLESKYIKNLVTEFIKYNSEEIENELFSNIDKSMITEEILSRMIVKSITVSSQIAVHLVVELLEQAGIVNLDEELLRRLSLYVVK